jgi:gliding motility-associated-like protein
LRNIFFILNFYCLTLFSQVGAPDLRCLQVWANGNVTVTWIAPADPGSQFNSYDIYYSPTSTGSFVVIGNINTINTTTFTHSGSNATNSSVYYYVKTKFGPGGASVSAPSDTLRSIFLNLLNTAGAPDVKIIYNNVHQAPLPSTSTSFSILKEYPAFTWSNLATTNKLNYADTISVCQASLNYQISLPDNSGCISSSNIQGGVYNDKKNPNQPYIDSISVLPNGNTVVSWHIPRDLDIVKYIIVKNINGINTPIDSVVGRNNTAYTFTTTDANSNAVQLYVFAVDSCSNPGGFNINPTTMFLKAKYDKCAYKTNLTWNPYINIPKGILEYRIYSSVNNSPYLKIGSTTETNFTVDNVQPNKNVCYFVRVINTDKNITSSSNRTCIFSTQVDASNFVYIKKASVKDKNSVEVTVFIDTTKTSLGIDIYRSEDGVNFNPIAFIPYSGNANFYYLDEKTETNSTSYYYKAIVKDSCGNSRTYSNVSKTILLKLQDDEKNIFTKHLSWSYYEGFAGGVSGYNIYRIINDVPSSSPVAYTGPTTSGYLDNLEDEASNGSKIEYLVEAVEGIGNPYGFLEASKSNTASVYMEGEIFVPTAFAPNGKNKIWLPITHFVDKSEYTVSVFNRWGNKIFETHDDTKGWNGNGANNDVYAYLITYKNSRGEYKEVKGTVLLME